MNQEKCIQLIQLYQNYVFLWDAKDRNHHNKTKREDAWKEMSVKMGQDVSTLKAKIKTLMGSYRSEKSREKKSRVTGSGSDDVYDSKWFGYKYFHFLNDKDKPKETQNTETENVEVDTEVSAEASQASTISASAPPNTSPTSAEGNILTPRLASTPRMQKTGVKRKASTQVSEESSQASSISASAPPNTSLTSAEGNMPTPSLASTSRMQKKRKASLEQNSDSTQIMTEALKILQSSANSSNDPYFTYALHLANELRKYDQHTLAHVKRSISKILFDADMGLFGASSRGSSVSRETLHHPHETSPTVELQSGFTYHGSLAEGMFPQQTSEDVADIDASLIYTQML